MLYDFGNSVRRYLDSIGRPYGFLDDADEPHTWNFFEHWKMDAAEFVKICHDGVDAGFIFSGPTRPNAVEAVRAVKDAGHDVIIITDRQFGTTPEASHKATLEWLAEHGFPYDEIWFSADKTVRPTDIFIEDKLQNYDAVTEVGTPCVLIDRPWNQDPGDYRFRIKDISEYPDIVELLATQHDKHPLIVV